MGSRERRAGARAEEKNASGRQRSERAAAAAVSEAGVRNVC